MPSREHGQPLSGTQQEYRYEPLNDPGQEIRLFYLEAVLPDLEKTPEQNAPSTDDSQDSISISGLEKPPERNAPSTDHCQDSISISGHIKHVPLDDRCPEYVALSYTWGSGDLPFRIRVDGFDLKVTANLHCVLGVLAKLPELRGRPLWIDAICIDQKNDSEKNYQVPLMGQIFGQASEVIAWIGGEEDESGDVLDNLVILGDHWLRLRERNYLGGLVSQFVSSLEQNLKAQGYTSPHALSQAWYTTEIPLTSIDNPVLRARLSLQARTQSTMQAFQTSACQPNTQVQKLLNRAWWHRVWVIQEVTLAKAVLLLCGTRLFSWEKVIGASHYFMDYRYEHQKGHPLPNSNSTGFYTPVEHFLVFWDLMKQELRATGGQRATGEQQATGEHLEEPSNKSRHKSQKLGLSLEQGLIYLMRLDCDAFQASDDRDRIYALLAFFSQSNRALIPVDYSKENTFSDVSNRITRRMLQKYGPRILAYCQNSSGSRINSSWYIDWTRTRTELAIFDPIYEAEFAAAGYETYYPEVLEVGGKVLVPIKGKKVSQIQHLAKFDISFRLPPSKEELPDHVKKFNDWFQMMRKLLEACPEGTKKLSSMDNLWLVPIAGFQRSRHSFKSQSTGSYQLEWPSCPFEAQMKTCRTRKMNGSGLYPYGTWSECARALRYRMSREELEEFGEFYEFELLRKSFKYLVGEEEYDWNRESGNTKKTVIWTYERRLKLNGNKGFVTSDSRAGLGPRSIRQDDLVVIFNGCEFPFVIRPHCEERKEYELVGACYVDGIMYGEAMEEKPTFEDMFLV